MILVDKKKDLEKEDFKNSIEQLRSAINEVQIYTEPAKWFAGLYEIDRGRAFFIAFGALDRHLVPEIHQMVSVHAIYILCDDEARYKQWVDQ